MTLRPSRPSFSIFDSTAPVTILAFTVVHSSSSSFGPITLGWRAEKITRWLHACATDFAYSPHSGMSLALRTAMSIALPVMSNPSTLHMRPQASAQSSDDTGAQKFGSLFIWLPFFRQTKTYRS